jgi:hypothetical protein
MTALNVGQRILHVFAHNLLNVPYHERQHNSFCLLLESLDLFLFDQGINSHPTCNRGLRSHWIEAGVKASISHGWLRVLEWKIGRGDGKLETCIRCIARGRRPCLQLRHVTIVATLLSCRRRYLLVLQLLRYVIQIYSLRSSRQVFPSRVR